MSAQTSAQVRPGAMDVGVVALCLLAVVSQVGSSVQAQGVDAAAVVLGSAGVVASVWLVVRGWRVERGRLFASGASFLVWVLVAAAMSGRLWSALVGEANYLLGFASLAAMAAVALFAMDRAAQVRRVLVAVAPWVILAEVSVVVAQLATGAQPTGTLPNSTYLGEFVLLMLPWVTVSDAPALLSRTMRLSVSAAAIVALGAAGARAAAVVALVWFAVQVISSSALPRRLRVWVTVGVLLAVLGAGFVFARAELIGSSGIDTLGERPAMWTVAAHGVAARPLLGYGPDGFIATARVLTPELAAAGPVVTFRPGAGDPHSVLAWVVVSTGLVGLLLFVWLVVEVASRWRSAAKHGADVAPAVWALGGAFAVFLTAPATIQVLPTFALVLGVSLVSHPPAGEGGLVTGWVRLVSLGTAAALGLASLVLATNAAWRFPLEVTGPQVSPARAESAAAASRLWRSDSHLAFLASLHLGYAALSNPDVAAQRPDLAAIERAAALDLRNPFYALEYARTLKFYGAFAAEIDAAFLATFDRYPVYPLARAEYAAFLAEQGRRDEAAEQIVIAELVPDNDPDRIAAIGVAERLIGEGTK